MRSRERTTEAFLGIGREPRAWRTPAGRGAGGLELAISPESRKIANTLLRFRKLPLEQLAQHVRHFHATAGALRLCPRMPPPPPIHGEALLRPRRPPPGRGPPRRRHP